MSRQRRGGAHHITVKPGQAVPRGPSLYRSQPARLDLSKRRRRQLLEYLDALGEEDRAAALEYLRTRGQAGIELAAELKQRWSE
jgi:hypothetical protein